MWHRVSVIAVLGTASVFAYGSIAPAKEYDRDPKAAEKLAQALEGRVAGPAVSCISNFRGQSDMDVIDDGTILFEDGGVVYLQRTRESCAPLKNGNYSLVSVRFGSGRICSNDINQMIDVKTGVSAGSCRFGPFVPYRKSR